MRYIIRNLMMVAIITLLSAVSGYAQASGSTAEVRGLITDSAGAVIPGAKVTITERGWVGPPPFRFLSKFVFGHETTLRQYLADLRACDAVGSGSPR